MNGLGNMTSAQMICSVVTAEGEKSRKAKEFLLEILANGGMAQRKIEEEAEKRGIKKKTLRNAKLELEIDSVKRGNQWFWMLSE